MKYIHNDTLCVDVNPSGNVIDNITTGKLMPERETDLIECFITTKQTRSAVKYSMSRTILVVYTKW